MRRRAGLVYGVILVSLLAAKPASAITLGDAALTTAITTGAGAALGASTLPFYGSSGDHTKNIFFGAALGAVAGVLLSAAAGVSGSELPEEEPSAPAAGAALLRAREYLLAQNARSVPDAPAVTSLTAKARGEVLVWAPVASVIF